jgi:hypothetical protein
VNKNSGKDHHDAPAELLLLLLLLSGRKIVACKLLMAAIIRRSSGHSLLHWVVVLLLLEKKEGRKEGRKEGIFIFYLFYLIGFPPLTTMKSKIGVLVYNSSEFSCIDMRKGRA